MYSSVTRAGYVSPVYAALILHTHVHTSFFKHTSGQVLLSLKGLSDEIKGVIWIGMNLCTVYSLVVIRKKLPFSIKM